MMPAPFALYFVAGPGQVVTVGAAFFVGSCSRQKSKQLI